MKVEIYIQARMGSTRLPGKILKTVLGKPLLEYLIERVKKVKNASTFAILTTTNPQDDSIADYCERHHVLYYRGSEEDVLTRYYEVGLKRKPDAIVRITADCPLVDPDVVDQAIQLFKDSQPDCDYLSNSLQRTYPRGLDVEVFSFKSLEQAHHQAQQPFEREHVTPYFYQHPNLFKLKNMTSGQCLEDYRWTVDTVEDLTLVTLILENLYPHKSDFKLKDILLLLKQHPEWNQINSHVKQKLLPGS